MSFNNIDTIASKVETTAFEAIFVHKNQSDEISNNFPSVRLL